MIALVVTVAGVALASSAAVTLGVLWLRERRRRVYLSRGHAALVSEALDAQRRGANGAEVARIVTGEHRTALGQTAPTSRITGPSNGDRS